MSDLNIFGICVDHDALLTVAIQLRKDGHLDLADEYSERAATEKLIFDSVGSLGRRAVTDMRTHGAEPPEKYGAVLAEWLVREGWTPPDHFASRITE